MIFYTVECEENGFFYESKSLIKICDMFNLNYVPVYHSVRNTLYNQRGFYMPSNNPNLKIKRHDR